ncbi:MAG: YbaB/EbfC family nucleoid-associated protein [Clostridia bacterium]|nr:YbaB/EbfC family nucleoid-associated protein [Clostridia bacterium]
MKVRIPQGGGAANMQNMIKKMQEDMVAKQEELEAREYEVSVGGGVVSVKMNGKKEVLSVKLAEEVVDPDDIETLEDLVVAAVNEAIKKVESDAADEMGQLTGGLNIPGMGGLGGLF